MEIYADHAATTPLCAEAAAAMQACWQGGPANPSSVHRSGRAAAVCLEQARRKIAHCLGAEPGEVYFTAGGTEANVWALHSIAKTGQAQNRRHLIVSAMEHHSVLRTAQTLAGEGYDLTLLPVGRDGMVHPGTLEKAITPETAGVCVMAANNETGVIQPVEQLAAVCREHRVLFCTDGVQAAGHIPFDFTAWGADFASVSAHKFGGPQGTGALLCRAGTELFPLLPGGGQEKGKRAGTHNVAGAAGMAAALEKSIQDREQTAVCLRRLCDALQEALQGQGRCHPVLPDAPRLPGTIGFYFDGMDGEEMLLRLDRVGICVSAGAACSSGETAPSHVMMAVGLTPKQAQSAIRVSFGPQNTQQEARQIGLEISKILGG